MTKKRLFLSGLHCTSCVMLIEGELMDIGVTAVCNYTKGHVDVAFDEEKIREKEIAGVIERLGYTVDRIQ